MSGVFKLSNKMQEFTTVEELFRLAFEAGEEYADSLEWATYADNFPRWYEKRKDEILQTILNEQAKCKSL